MYDELTEIDIAKMREEIDHRVNVLRPKLIEDVQTARAFGDLSENFEYKAAKQEKNRNDSRIRYLERMIKTAKVIAPVSNAGEVGLFDTVELYFEEDGTSQTIRLVTTLRGDALQGLISPKSPLGKALMGHRAGDRVHIEVNPEYGYDVVIRSIEKGADDATLPISTF
jgi:transcription elongation factor GreA